MACNGKETRYFHSAIRQGTRKAGIIPGQRLRAMAYARFHSLPIGPDPAAFRESIEYVPAALARPDLYRVHPKLELVDGNACHLITSDQDAIWIDHRHGFGIRRRVYFILTGPKDPGCLSSVQMAGDYHDLGDGLWLPKAGVFLIYTAQADPESMRGKLAHVQTTKVSRLEVNNVPDSLFELSFPGGTMVYDEIESKVYTAPHGEGMLDRALAEGQPIVAGQILDPPTLPFPTKVLLMTAGVLASLIAALWLWRRRRAKAAGSGESGDRPAPPPGNATSPTTP